jgi:hypothetical protein
MKHRMVLHCNVYVTVNVGVLYGKKVMGEMYRWTSTKDAGDVTIVVTVRT